MLNSSSSSCNHLLETEVHLKNALVQNSLIDIRNKSAESISDGEPRYAKTINQEEIYQASNLLNKIQKYNYLVQSVMEVGLLSSFIYLHRILHPFTSQMSSTTALLLDSLQMRVMETTQQFGNPRQSWISLFVCDKRLITSWNPLTTPLPFEVTTSNDRSDTFFTRLLRIYVIRRDVTAYFNALWTVHLPAVWTLVTAQKNDPVSTYINVFKLARRLLNRALQKGIICLMPSPAAAVCRALHHLGGIGCVAHFVLNFLILPSLLKIVVAEDLESLDNELPLHDEKRIAELYDRYFDPSLWWPHSRSNNHAPAPKQNWSSADALVWTVWRLFSAAWVLDEIEVLSVSASNILSEIFATTTDAVAISDATIRASLSKLKRSIDLAVSTILQLPLDSEAHRALAIDDSLTFKTFGNNVSADVPYTVLLKRLCLLVEKPMAMLLSVVISRKEIYYFAHALSETLSREDGEFFDLHEAIEVVKNWEGEKDSLLLLRVKPAENVNHQWRQELIKTILNLRARINSDTGDRANENTELDITIEEINLSTLPADAVTYQIAAETPLFTAVAANAVSLYELEQLQCGLAATRRMERSLESLLLSESAGVRLGSTAQSGLRFSRHTQSSARKAAVTTNYGFEQLTPTVRKYYDQAGDAGLKFLVPCGDISLRNLSDHFPSTLRFGSADSRSQVGTSIARLVTLPPAHPSSPQPQVKLTYRGDVDIDNIESNGSFKSKRSASRYTNFEIERNANILLATESSSRQYVGATSPLGHADYDRLFKSSLRIGTTNSSKSAISSSSKSTDPLRQTSRGSTTIMSPSIPKLFPDSLRHLVRQRQTQSSADTSVSQTTVAEAASATVDRLDFENGIISPIKPSGHATAGAYCQRSRRSPYEFPTKAHLNKLANYTGQRLDDIRLQEELSLGATPGLRRSATSESELSTSAGRSVSPRTRPPFRPGVAGSSSAAPTSSLPSPPLADMNAFPIDTRSVGHADSSRASRSLQTGDAPTIIAHVTPLSPPPARVLSFASWSQQHSLSSHRGKKSTRQSADKFSETRGCDDEAFTPVAHRESVLADSEPRKIFEQHINVFESYDESFLTGPEDLAKRTGFVPNTVESQMPDSVRGSASDNLRPQVPVALSSSHSSAVNLSRAKDDLKKGFTIFKFSDRHGGKPKESRLVLENSCIRWKSTNALGVRMFTGSNSFIKIDSIRALEKQEFPNLKVSLSTEESSRALGIVADNRHLHVLFATTSERDHVYACLSSVIANKY